MSGSGEWGVAVYPELRVQIAPSRYRIPDMCVVAAEAPFERVLTRPPLLCMEILSSQDRWARITEGFEDYRRMGVATLWAVDPLEGKAWVWTRSQPEWREETLLGFPALLCGSMSRLSSRSWQSGSRAKPHPEKRIIVLERRSSFPQA